MTKKQIRDELLRRLKEGRWVYRAGVVALIKEVTAPGAKPFRFPWERRPARARRLRGGAR